ncbi:hypothetical protein AC629_34320 [Bradyrhizobium sp. NAS80.1]|nr:hypothetical protein AC629_34320 [Bradyrhizobium sp. NAS80.1]
MAALVQIAANLRAILAPHVALQFMNRRCLRPPHDVQGDGLIGVATETSDFEVQITRIEGVTQRGRRLRRSLEGKHALIPCLTGQLVGLPARFCCLLSSRPDRSPVDGLA